jgi:hypothetical protein
MNRTARLMLIALLALGACSVVASEAGATRHHAHGAKLSAPRYTTLDQAVAAGRLDAAVARKLRADGVVDALVTYQTEAAFSRASQVASHVRRAQRTASFLRTATAELRGEERRTLTRVSGSFRVLDRFENLPLTYVRFESAKALLDTVNAADVSGVRANKRFRMESVNSLPLIRQPETAAAGFTGAGTYVAVLDSGVRYRKSAFGCRKPGKPARCRVAMAWDQAKNDRKLDDDGHGTNVSGIIAAVAPGAKLIVADVFDKQGYTSTKIVSKAIDRIVRLKRRGLNIRAINLSLGDSSAHTGPCADSAYAPAFALARSAGILPVVAAGNDAYAHGSFRLGLDDPACAPGAISVGAVYASSYGAERWMVCTDKTTAPDQVTCFSQTGDQLTLLAPGSEIKAAGITESGTSQATPHVAASVAVLAAANPLATIDQIAGALAGTGPSITDPRSQITRHRLDLAAAVAAIRGGGGGTGGGDKTPPAVSGPSQGIPAGWTLGTAGATPLSVSWSASDASGIAQYRLVISVDGGVWRDITLGSATQTSITFNDLAPGSSYQFGVAAQDRAGNWSNVSFGPKSTVGLYNESAGRYSNGWEQLAWGQDLGGYQDSTSVTGAYMTFDFTGREVAWIAPSSALNGYAHVWLDNQDLGSVNEYSASTLARKVQLSVGTSYGAHRLTIQAVGTSGHPQVDVDAFVVLG